MKWIPYPLAISDDPRMDTAGEAAEVLWTRAWTWCGKHALDGRVPKRMVARLCPTDTDARVTALIETGLWIEEDDAYQVADWDDITGDVTTLVKRRQADSERQQRHRARLRQAAERRAAENGQTSLLVDVSRDMSRDTYVGQDVSASASDATVVPLTAPPSGQPGTEDTASGQDVTGAEGSRPQSRDSHVTVTPLEVDEELLPPTPLASEGGPPASSTSPPHTPAAPRPGAGSCDPRTRPHARCRGCGTDRRAGRRAAADRAAAEAAAQQAAALAHLDELRAAREAVPWCGDHACRRVGRMRITDDDRLAPCPRCHPDVVVGPLPAPAPVPATAAGGRASRRQPAF